MNLFEGAPIISAYTRAQAIEDGVLVDVSPVAREAGFTVPVALTAAAHADAVEWDSASGAHQDTTGRLWDVLTMARLGAAQHQHSDRAPFRVIRIPNRPDAVRATLTELVLHIGPGDDPSPVITIMRPDED